MNQSNGTWKKDPRGVDYISFVMPDELAGVRTHFVFKTPDTKEEIEATVTTSDKILGVIILMKPKNYGKN